MKLSSGKGFLPAFVFCIGELKVDYVEDIYRLSAQFYLDYPRNEYPEILSKTGRPYACLLIEYIDDIFICIPYRSHIQHKNAFLFKGSLRSKRNSSGLDYSKIILIKDDKYLGGMTVVDVDEYKETRQNMERIINEVHKYISDYIKDLNGIQGLHPKEWQRRYGMSTLPYFNDLLKQVIIKDLNNE